MKCDACRARKHMRCEGVGCFCEHCRDARRATAARVEAAVRTKPAPTRTRPRPATKPTRPKPKKAAPSCDTGQGRGGLWGTRKYGVTPEQVHQAALDLLDDSLGYRPTKADVARKNGLTYEQVRSVERQLKELARCR